eukprot:1160755-Pelagomonas_calceolata.AAC.3
MAELDPLRAHITNHAASKVYPFQLLLQLIITNLPESHYEEVEAKVLPGRSDAGYKVSACVLHAVRALADRSECVQRSV